MVNGATAIPNSMGNDKQYIYMCTHARALRSIWAPQLGDLYYAKLQKVVHVVIALPFSRLDHVWLPRVDQMFDMVSQRYNVRFRPAFTINKFHQYIMSHTPRHAGSVEQLLLQFVMLEVYGKVFSSRSWVTCNESSLEG
jgi:hypothetical protein